MNQIVQLTPKQLCDDFIDETVSVLNKYIAMGLDLCAVTNTYSILLLRANLNSTGELDDAAAHVGHHMQQSYEFLRDNGAEPDRKVKRRMN